MGKKKQAYTSDEQELERTFQRITGSKVNSTKDKHHSKSISIVICIVLAAIFVCTGSFLFYLIHQENNRIIQADVSVCGIKLQGMTQAEAISAIEAGYHPKAMTVTVQNHSVQIPADYVMGLNIRRAVRAACNLSSDSGTTVLDLKLFLKIDEEKVRNRLEELGTFFNTTLQESSYQILGQSPAQVLQITLGIPEYGLDLDQLYQDVLAAYGMGLSNFEGQCNILTPKPIDLETIQAAYCRPAIDAAYDMSTHKVMSGEEGYGFSLDTVADALHEAEYGTTLEFPFTAIPPSITREDVIASFFQDTLGTFTAKSSSQSNRDTNLRLACEAINGLVLYPGDSFSYNKTLGERTPEKGYQPADTYVGNETVHTYGGGICQVSSSLYYCVLMAELTVIERTNHSFLPSYMPRGLDATVSWGTLDFRFKNTLDYPVRIEATAKGGTTTVKLLGTETRNYRVEPKASVIEKTPYTTEYRIMSPDNKEGYKDGDVIVKPHSGYYVKSYLYKYEKNSDKLISKEYIDDSNYRIRNAVICQIDASSGEESKLEETIPEFQEPSTAPSTSVSE